MHLARAIPFVCLPTGAAHCARSHARQRHKNEHGEHAARCTPARSRSVPIVNRDRAKRQGHDVSCHINAVRIGVECCAQAAYVLVCMFAVA